MGQSLGARVKHNKGKFIVLLLYVLVVLAAPPLLSVIPGIRDNGQRFAKSLVPSETDQFLRGYMELLRSNQADKAHSLLSPQTQQDVSMSSVQQLCTYFSSTTDEMEIISAQTNALHTGKGTTKTYDITYQVRTVDPIYPYAMVEAVEQTTSAGMTVTGIHIKQLTASAKDQHRLDGNQWVYLIIACLLPLFIAYTALRYLMNSAKPTWKMLLIILLLSLYVSVSANGFTFSLGVFSVIQDRGILGSWTFMMPIPLGAIYYWWSRHRRSASSNLHPSSLRGLFLLLWSNMLDKLGKIFATRGGFVAFTTLVILAINLAFDEGSFKGPYSLAIWLVEGIVLGLILDAGRKNSPVSASLRRNNTTTLRRFIKMIRQEVAPTAQEDKDEYFEYICGLQKIYEKRSLKSDLLGYGFVSLIILAGVLTNHGLSVLYDLVLLSMLYFIYSAFHVRVTLRRIYRIKEKFYGVKPPDSPPRSR